MDEKAFSKACSQLVNELKKFKGEIDPEEVELPKKRGRSSELNFEDFIIKIKQRVYFSSNQIEEDFNKLIKGHVLGKFQVKKKIESLSSYLNQHLEQLWENIQRYGNEYPFVAKKTEEVKERDYETITDYFPIDQSDLSELNTRKVNTCDGKCCSKLENLGPFDYKSLRWKTKSTDRKFNVECNEGCKCNARKCQNRQIKLDQKVKLGKDIREQITWGYDLRTQVCMMSLLGNTKRTSEFVGKFLPKIINQLGGLELRESLEYILDEHRVYAETLLNGIGALEQSYGETVWDYFRIHPKGKGVICKKKGGIQKNSLITEYFGELFSPPRWYEKQDYIKTEKKKQSQMDLPEFYNIWIERHFDDPEGYDLMMVDPYSKGNFGSRLSHCCDANCGTVTMISNGKYTVGMYALKDIEYGEELTFNYCSFTESKKEHEEAVCLCSNKLCTGQYLGFTEDKSERLYFGKFLERMALVLEACNRSLDEELKKCLKEYHIKEKLLRDCPEWLKVWAALVVSKSVKKGTKAIKNPQAKRNFKQSALRELAISINKIKYFLKNSKSDHKPLKILEEEEVLEYLWGESKGSIKSQVEKVCSEKKVQQILKRRPEFPKEAKKHLKEIAEILRKTKLRYVSEILDLITNTETFFKEQKYKAFKSEPIEIRNCDIFNNPEEPYKVYDKARKTYKSKYVLGVMSRWFVQNIKSPWASYSSEKRNTVELPSIVNSLTKDTQAIQKDIKRIKKNQTPKNKALSFKKSLHILGSPMFDLVYSNSSN